MLRSGPLRAARQTRGRALTRLALCLAAQGAPLNEPDHCGDPPLLLAAGNGVWPRQSASRAPGRFVFQNARLPERARTQATSPS
jgi:hypothetical protein